MTRFNFDQLRVWLSAQPYSNLVRRVVAASGGVESLASDPGRFEVVEQLRQILEMDAKAEPQLTWQSVHNHLPRTFCRPSCDAWGTKDEIHRCQGNIIDSRGIVICCELREGHCAQASGKWHNVFVPNTMALRREWTDLADTAGYVLIHGPEGNCRECMDSVNHRCPDALPIAPAPVSAPFSPNDHPSWQLPITGQTQGRKAEPPQFTVDPVDAINPSHYRAHPSGVECIQITEHMNFTLGNAVKYIWRAGLKSKNPIEDLKKARWYLDREIARREKDA